MTDLSSDGTKAKPGAAKSASAFRTISEVSVELEVPQHVLRFWETKFPQVKPMKRGGGRRYYRPDDVELLRRIQSLLYQDGYTIKGVQKLLRESRGLAGLPPPGTRMPSLFDADEPADEAGGADHADPDIPAEGEGEDDPVRSPGPASSPGPAPSPVTATSRRAPLSPDVRQALSETLMDLLAIRRLLE
ncbi:MerR family transcriptional regulator [Niveispirillum fermenti]|uniref:MerR family transcriptional regulator n=1 Tax=Niveispirillum fermenti TaxID=1233113 RepID=UPI003A840B77